MPDDFFIVSDWTVNQTTVESQSVYSRKWYSSRNNYSWANLPYKRLVVFMKQSIQTRIQNQHKPTCILCTRPLQTVQAWKKELWFEDSAGLLAISRSEFEVHHGCCECKTELLLWNFKHQRSPVLFGDESVLSLRNTGARSNALLGWSIKQRWWSGGETPEIIIPNITAQMN